MNNRQIFLDFWLGHIEESHLARKKVKSQISAAAASSQITHKENQD